MENQLIPIDQSQTGDLQAASKLFGSSDFLGRLQLMTDKTSEVKADKFPKNHWAFIPTSNTLIDLGGSVNIVPIAFRVKAMRQTADGGMEISYDLNDPLFAEIQSQAEAGFGSGAMFGPSILVWIPEAVDGEGRFAEFFLISKSSRFNGPALRERLGRGVTLVPVFKDMKYSWWTFEVKPCDTIVPEQLPDPESLAKETHRFLNPPKQEKVDPAAVRDR